MHRSLIARRAAVAVRCERMSVMVKVDGRDSKEAARQVLRVRNSILLARSGPHREYMHASAASLGQSFTFYFPT